MRAFATVDGYQFIGTTSSGPMNVRFGSQADICSAPTNVRFTPNSDAECVHLKVRR